MATKILFFDDEKRIAEVLQKNLELFDFEVTLVSTIREFVAEINKTNITYNLLLMDVMAPLPSEEESKWFTEEEIEHMGGGLNTGVVLIDKIRSFSQEYLDSMSFGLNVGEVLSDKVRNIARYADIPILFYSAKSSIKQFSNASIIIKPALAKDIVEEIKALLKGDVQ